MGYRRRTVAWNKVIIYLNNIPLWVLNVLQLKLTSASSRIGALFSFPLVCSKQLPKGWLFYSQKEYRKNYFILSSTRPGKCSKWMHRGHTFSTYAKFPKKLKYSTPWYAHAQNVRFSESFAYVLNWYPQGDIKSSEKLFPSWLFCCQFCKISWSLDWKWKKHNDQTNWGKLSQESYGVEVLINVSFIGFTNSCKDDLYHFLTLIWLGFRVFPPSP